MGMSSDKKKILIDALKRYHDCAFTPGVYEHSIFGQAALMLENHAEVVRCKDCKHWLKDVAGCTDQVGRCEFANYMVGAVGYCVYGERKDNE